MNFDHFQKLVDNFFAVNENGELLPGRYDDVPVERLPALVLAYIGDAYFTAEKINRGDFESPLIKGLIRHRIYELPFIFRESPSEVPCEVSEEHLKVKEKIVYARKKDNISAIAQLG